MLSSQHLSKIEKNTTDSRESIKELKSLKNYLDKIIIMILKEITSNTHLIPPVLRIYMAILEA